MDVAEEMMRGLMIAGATGESLCLYDEKGRLVGTIDRPVSRDLLGPGRETVYLSRSAQPASRPVAA